MDVLQDLDWPTVYKHVLRRVLSPTQFHYLLLLKPDLLLEPNVILSHGWLKACAFRAWRQNSCRLHYGQVEGRRTWPVLLDRDGQESRCTICFEYLHEHTRPLVQSSPNSGMPIVKSRGCGHCLWLAWTHEFRRRGLEVPEEA